MIIVKIPTWTLYLEAMYRPSWRKWRVQLKSSMRYLGHVHGQEWLSSLINDYFCIVFFLLHNIIIKGDSFLPHEVMARFHWFRLHASSLKGQNRP